MSGASGEKDCVDCRASLITLGEYRYMLWNRIWKQAGLAPSQVCCLNCVEARLGRELAFEDFSDSPLNSLQVDKSPRLLVLQRLATWTKLN